MTYYSSKFERYQVYDKIKITFEACGDFDGVTFI